MGYCSATIRSRLIGLSLLRDRCAVCENSMLSQLRGRLIDGGVVIRFYIDDGLKG